MSGSAPRLALPEVGASIEVTVGAVAHGGHCVARTPEGIVVFVRHAIPDERVIVSVTGHGKGGRYVEADAVEIIDASPDRREPPCRYARPGACGGCDWQHVTAEAQRRLKTDVVREAMSRFASVELPSDFAVQGVAGDTGLGWRMRMSVHVERTRHDELVFGLRRRSSREVVGVLSGCEIAAPEFREFDEEELAKGISGDRVVLVKPSVGEAFVVPGRASDEASKDLTVTERVGEVDFAVAADGFWQVHPAAAETLLGEVRDFLKLQPGESLLDLYSGVGLFGLSLASELAGSPAGSPDSSAQGGSVTLIEGDRRAADLAALNAEQVPVIRDGRVRVRALRGNVTQLGERRGAAVLRTLQADAVVLDPPRTGAGKGVVAAIASLAPRAVAYVACDPVALARDVAYFRAEGYVLERLAGWDLFPQTHHVECVALLVPGAAQGEVRGGGR